MNLLPVHCDCPVIRVCPACYRSCEISSQSECRRSAHAFWVSV